MDGAQLSFRTLNIVKNDEEIFISYIDTTNSFSRRQFELKDRYMFTCRCNKCRRGPTLQEDSLLVPVNEVSQRIEKSVRDAPDLGVMVPSALANGDYSHSVGEIEDTVSKCIEDCEKEGDPDKAYVHLNSTIQILAEIKIWPVHRQPFPALRHEIFICCLSRQLYMQAFFHGLFTYFNIHPILYPQRHHPVRVKQTWVLAMLTLFLVAEGNNREIDPTGTVESAPDKFAALMYGLMSETALMVGKSHGKDSSFAEAVKKKLSEVSGDMAFGNPTVLQEYQAAFHSSLPYFRQLAEKGVKYSVPFLR